MSSAPVPDGWDERLVLLHGHFLQSGAWARVQRRLGHDVVFGEDARWAWLGVVRRTGPFSYLYLPFGPALRAPADLEPALVAARKAARVLGCVFVRFEPGAVSAANVSSTGAHRVPSRQYEHTLILSLDADEAALRRGLNSGHRSRINGAAKRGLVIERSNDPGRMPDFVRLLRDTERRASFFSYEDPYFEAVGQELLPTGEASLYFAMAGTRCAAAALVFDFGPTRYYAFGATDTASRSLMPAPPLVWRGIVDAHDEGRRRFDFWGAAPPGAGPDHPWRGITDFKRGFGGQPESYAGTWELTVRPVATRLFALARALRREVTRLSSRRSRSDS